MLHDFLDLELHSVWEPPLYHRASRVNREYGCKKYLTLIESEGSVVRVKDF